MHVYIHFTFCSIPPGGLVIFSVRDFSYFNIFYMRSLMARNCLEEGDLRLEGQYEISGHIFIGFNLALLSLL